MFRAMILAERDGERTLPIWIGPAEAAILALALAVACGAPILLNRELFDAADCRPAGTRPVVVMRTATAEIAAETQQWIAARRRAYTVSQTAEGSPPAGGQSAESGEPAD